jgi:Zn-finger nucleic acid-binding protein
MAVELRCPECRAKLRLPRAPEPDSEIECPKCGNVFPTDDNLVHAGDADGADKPAKANAEKQPQPTSEPKKTDKTKAAEKPFKRKKRRAKKKKTNPVLMWSIIGGAAMVLGFCAVVLIWMMSKKTQSQEMMSYLPDDCDEVTGIDLGHLQKYPEFYKQCEQTFGSKGFKKAADVFSKALGSEMKDVVEYVIQGEGKSGGKPDGSPLEATVLRTKTEFDASLLKKIPGAQEYTAEGVKYYTIDDIPELSYPGLRVFAPTNRLVVFCRGDMPEGKFKAMLTGNRDNSDGVVYKRCGPLFKQVTRGTGWKFVLYGRSVAKPAPPPATPGGQRENEEEMLKKEISDLLNSAQGYGIKASVGSRDVRGEWVIWFKDSDAASNQAKTWKDKDWVQDGEKPPPKWWKTIAQKSGAGKTAENAIKDGLAFRSSGETFSIRSSLEAKTLGVSQLIQVFGNQSGGRSGPVMPGGPGGPGASGGPGGPKMPGGPGGPGGPKMPGPPGMPGGPGQPGKRRRFRVNSARASFPFGPRSVS